MILSPDLTLTQRAAVEAAGIGELLELAMGALGLGPRAVNCRLTGPEEVRELNHRFAATDSATDVLAFPAADARPGAAFVPPPGSELELGDIAISVEAAGTQMRGGWDDELRLLAVHGLLHLVGHDHHFSDEAAAMTTATREILALDATRRGAPEPPVPELLPARSH